MNSRCGGALDQGVNLAVNKMYAGQQGCRAVGALFSWSSGPEGRMNTGSGGR